MIPLKEEKLTARQERFVQNIVNGMTQRQAYKAAFRVVKMKDEVVDVRACELFKKSKIQVRYQELMAKLEDESIMTAKERMIWLSEVIKGIQTEKEAIFTDDDVIVKDVEANLSTKIKAMDTLNKMTGEYKTILSGEVGITYEEALKKVSGNNEY